MASEPKRGCGYRKVGGTYLVGGGIGRACDRLPFELTVCPCCSAGVKPALGWTWIDVAKFFQGPHLVPGRYNHVQTRIGNEPVPCECGMFPPSIPCALCHAPQTMGRAGLLWIGHKFYKTPDMFVKEGIELGFSRRIKAIPHGFKIGETWVMLAHRNAVSRKAEVNIEIGKKAETETVHAPGIFYVWLPQRVEVLFKESERGSEKVDLAEKRGITAVYVPDDDPDHQGNVHDDFEAEQKQKKLDLEEN